MSHPRRQHPTQDQCTLKPEEPVLDSSVTVVNKLVNTLVLAEPVGYGHIECVNSQLGIHGVADLPAHDSARAHVGKKRGVDLAG